MARSKKDEVPSYVPPADTLAPSRNDILSHYGLGPGGPQETDQEREMREWEKQQEHRLNGDTAAPPSARVALSDLTENPDNPRGEIDQYEDEFRGLLASVTELGVIQALTICSRGAFIRHHPKHADTVTTAWVVVAGHRRMKAAALAGLTSVPAVVNDDAAENPLMWAVAENLQRVGLTPIKEAETLRVLTDDPPAGQGLSQTTVASGIGKSQGFVSQRVALLKLAPSLRRKVHLGQLKVKRGGLLAKLPEDQQIEAADQLEKLTPALQAEVDGGKLTDLDLALKVAALPQTQQHAARTNGGLAPVQGGKRRAVQAVPQVALRDPEQIARDIAGHLAPDQMVRLAELLTEHAAQQSAPITQ